MRPTLITLTIGRQNSRWVDQIDKCFKNIKDHDFLDANTCALAILADTGAATTLRNNLSDILNKYKTQMAGNPNLVVAVTGYFNPYPQATSVATKIPGFCAKLQDTDPHLHRPVDPAAAGPGHPRPGREAAQRHDRAGRQAVPAVVAGTVLLRQPV